MEDKRDVLRDEKPFSFVLTKEGKVFVSFHGKRVMVLPPKEAARFAKVAASGDEYAIQLFLAKATGNFKHGNER